MLRGFRSPLLWCLSVMLLTVRLSAQAPLTVEAVAGDERLWPREVITKAASTVTVDGRNVTVPAGEIVRLLRVEREAVVVQFQGTTVRLPPQQTDLLAGATTRRSQLGIAVPAAGGPSPGPTRTDSTKAAPPAATRAPTPIPTTPPAATSVLRPTPKDLSVPDPNPLTPKAQADRVVRNVVAREGIWFLGVIAAAIAIAVIGKRFIDS